MARVTVDGRAIEAAEGTPLLQAMLDAGIDIPHYCYHPKLTIDGSCRLCQVKIEGMPKLQISCNTPVRDGMVVDASGAEVAEARRGVLELLLINHPLDCPICDKAGECWLQNYSMRFGSRLARTLEPRRKHGKRLDIGERMLLDQERCILCRRCVRFCREISKTGELVIFEQGDHSLLDIYDQRLDNPYSMCTADICPVGALETKDFHHKIRVWFLEETASVCPGCSNGCNIMVCHHLDRVWRLLPRRNDAVNETWMCDAGRFTYKPLHSAERIFAPMLMRDGHQVAVNWDEALEAAANGLRRVADKYGGAALGAVASPHLTIEDNFHFRKMLDALGVSATAMAVVRGDSDDFLIKPEKAPNARGVRELGMVRGADDGLENLLHAAEAGSLKALYVCGNDLAQVADRERLERILERLEFLVVQAMLPRPPLTRAAVMIPATAFAEKTGTFVNHAGRAQRIEQAISLPPGWYRDAEVFLAIRNRIRSEYHRFDLRETWREIAREHPAFASIETLEAAGAQLGAGASEAAAA
jgi:NADH-quinone oxidoreductase subunit G